MDGIVVRLAETWQGGLSADDLALLLIVLGVVIAFGYMLIWLIDKER